ncbi:MAG: conjugal transfer protein TraD [Candidatus Sphingomonas phytovorans]|nr:conjugal transfer protein TraD [Sphingomonas sp.]WEJ99475.1 MAG: conjugal transfer protein TraD [Sphingomonas sp.]
MRKPRDFDAELKVLGDKAKHLKERKLVQLGELVITTGADALPVELLAGALLTAVTTKDPGLKEGWRKSGAAFFHRSSDVRPNTRGNVRRAAPDTGEPAPRSAEGSAQ